MSYAVDTNVTGLAGTAGAGSADRLTRSSNMDQLTYRNNRDMKHFDEDDWTILGWQGRRDLDAPAMQGKDSDIKDSRKSDTVIGVVYVGVLIAFMLVHLT